jgi:hypothetical protein
VPYFLACTASGDPLSVRRPVRAALPIDESFRAIGRHRYLMHSRQLQRARRLAGRSPGDDDAVTPANISIVLHEVFKRVTQECVNIPLPLKEDVTTR